MEPPKAPKWSAEAFTFTLTSKFRHQQDNCKVKLYWGKSVNKNKQ